jgi:hypothetical protein
MEPDDLARPFFDRFAALNFLRPFASDPAAMAALRELAARCSGDRSFGRLAPNHEVLLQLAWRLHERLLFLVPLEPVRDSSGPGAGTGSQTETAETQAQGSEHGRPGQADESETVRLRGPAPAPPTAPPPTPKAAAPLAGTTHWITFQLVDDETGKPIAGVDLRVALSDGNTQTYRTGADGTVHVADIPDGTCDLEELLDGQGFEVIALE